MLNYEYISDVQNMVPSYIGNGLWYVGLEFPAAETVDLSHVLRRKYTDVSEEPTASIFRVEV
jgi:hypothetical protein